MHMPHSAPRNKHFLIFELVLIPFIFRSLNPHLHHCISFFFLPASYILYWFGKWDSVLSLDGTFLFSAPDPFFLALPSSSRLMFSYCCVFPFFFVILALKPRAFLVLGKHTLHHWANPPAPSALGAFILATVHLNLLHSCIFFTFF